MSPPFVLEPPIISLLPAAVSLVSIVCEPLIVAWIIGLPVGAGSGQFGTGKRLTDRTGTGVGVDSVRPAAALVHIDEVGVLVIPATGYKLSYGRRRWRRGRRGDIAPLNTKRTALSLTGGLSGLIVLVISGHVREDRLRFGLQCVFNSRRCQLQVKSGIGLGGRSGYEYQGEEQADEQQPS